MPRKSNRPAARAPKPRTKSAHHAATRDDAKQHTRAAIVQAALELFAEHGLDVPSLDAICDRAGYTRGAFYVHFKTREDILVAVMEQVGATFLTSVFQGLTSGAPVAAAGGPARPERRLHHAVRRFVDAVASGAYPLMGSGDKRPMFRPHQLLDACARSAVVRERYRDLVQLSLGAVAGLVKEDQDDGEVRKDVNPQTVATMALALIVGAQTMSDLGLSLDPTVLGAAIETMLAPR